MYLDRIMNGGFQQEILANTIKEKADVPVMIEPDVNTAVSKALELHSRKIFWWPVVRSLLWKKWRLYSNEDRKIRV